VDKAVVDHLDLFTEGGGFCEIVERPGGPAGPGGPGAGAGASFKLKAPSSVRWSVLANKGLAIEIQCADPCSIDAGLFASAGTADRFNLAGRRAVRVGRGRGSLNAAGKAKVRVKLTRKTKRRLRRARGLSLTLRVSVKGVGGAKASRSKKVNVKR
jgi:hypothetical protein